MKKLIITIIVTVLGSLPALSQGISVLNFKPDPESKDAMMPDTRRDDGNGGNCAIIKIRTSPPTDGFSFEAGQSGVESVEKIGETWVYIPALTKSLTIRHPKLGVLDHWQFPLLPNEGAVYILTLSVDKVETVVKKRKPQFVVFTVSPYNAVLHFDGEPILLDGEGKGVSDLMNPGTYRWKAEAKNYHPKEGTVTVSESKVEYTISLVPAFGYLVVDGAELSGAKAILDDNTALTLPLSSYELASGKHKITIIKPLHDKYTKNFVISDGQETVIKPELVSNAATVSITTDDSKAEIWIKGEKYGTGSWSGLLSSGKYEVEARRANCESQYTTVVVKKGENGQRFKIAKPVPITGSLYVDSDPKFADIYLDGQEAGQTPFLFYEIEIGTHNIKIVKEGYITYDSEIVISKGKKAEFTPTLKRGEQYARITVTSQEKADILLNSTFLTDGPSWSGYLPKGSYTFETCKGANYDNGVYELNVTSFTETKVALPPPTIKKGHFKVAVSPSDATLTLNGKKLVSSGGYYRSEPLAIGSYSITASAPNHQNATRNFTVEPNCTNEIKLKLKPYAYSSIYTGLQLGYDINNSKFLTGAYFNWQPCFAGFYGSASVGWNKLSYYFSGGLSLRLTKKYSNTSFSLYGGAGLGGQDGLFYEGGLQLGFGEEKSVYSKYNLRLGTMYNPSTSSFTPTLGLSWHIPGAVIIAPFAYMFDVADNEYIPIHSLATAAYDIGESEFLFGTDLMWMKNNLGAYAGFMYGLDNTISASIGPSVRLSSLFDWERPDLSLYSAFGYHGGDFLTRFGLLIGWDSYDRHEVFSLGDIQLGAGVHGGEWMFTFGADWLTTGTVALVGLAVFLCILPFGL